MLKGLSWRSAVVVAVCLFAVLSLLPNFLPQSVRDGLPGLLPKPAITLGLDLQGGSYLLLEVDVARRVQASVSRAWSATSAPACAPPGSAIAGSACRATRCP